MPKQKKKKLRESFAVLEAVVQTKGQWSQVDQSDNLELNDQVVAIVQYNPPPSNNMRPLVVNNGVVTQFTEGDGVIVPGVAASTDVLLSPANGSRVKLGPVFLPTSRIVAGQTLASLANGYAGYNPLGFKLTSNVTAYIDVNGSDVTGGCICGAGKASIRNASHGFLVTMGGILLDTVNASYNTANGVHSIFNSTCIIRSSVMNNNVWGIRAENNCYCDTLSSTFSGNSSGTRSPTANTTGNTEAYIYG